MIFIGTACQLYGTNLFHFFFFFLDLFLMSLAGFVAIYFGCLSKPVGILPFLPFFAFYDLGTVLN